ncbi:MAG: hypothetical protein R3F11_31085 [Verrucomicrobiales bacterium]
MIGVCEPVDKLPDEHPKRPVEGFACQRSEVSGKRLWGLFAERFGAADAFFRDHFVLNLPARLHVRDRREPHAGQDRRCRDRARQRGVRGALCGGALRSSSPNGSSASVLAEGRARALRRTACPPRSARSRTPARLQPRANRGWAEAATKQLAAQDLVTGSTAAASPHGKARRTASIFPLP